MKIELNWMALKAENEWTPRYVRDAEEEESSFKYL